VGITQLAAGQKLTAATINQLPVVVSYLSTGSGGTSSTSEVQIGSFTIPANDPTNPGGYWWKIHTTCTAASSPTLTVRLRLNTLAGTILAVGDASNTVSLSNGIIQHDGWVGFEAIGSSGSFGSWCATYAFLQAATTTTHVNQTDGTAINTTISNSILVTAQYGASNAGNTATTRFGSLYRL